jgi:hypothetical protein
MRNFDMPDVKDKAPELSEEEAARAEGLVKMVLDGAVSFVHATTVAAHEAVGWRVV